LKFEHKVVSVCLMKGLYIRMPKGKALFVSVKPLTLDNRRGVGRGLLKSKVRSEVILNTTQYPTMVSRLRPEV
jgi:hypothetical protein